MSMNKMSWSSGEKALAAVCLSLLGLVMAGSFWTREREEWKIIQLTHCREGASFSPKVSMDGKKVFFLSTCDFTDENRDHGPEVFKWEKGKISQLTKTELCQIADLALSPRSSLPAFASDCPFNGKNQDRGMEIVYLDREGEPVVVTQGMGFTSRNPAFSAEESLIFFDSYADFNGKNQDHSREIFAAEINVRPPSVKQLSNTRQGRQCHSPLPGQGFALALCDEDFPGTESEEAEKVYITRSAQGGTVGGNPDHNFELFRVSLSGAVSQLTRTRGCEIQSAAFSAEGSVAALVSNCNLAEEEREFPEGFRLFFLVPTVVDPYPSLSFSGRDLCFSGEGKKLFLSSGWGKGSINQERNPEVFMVSITRAPGEGGMVIFKAEPPTALTDYDTSVVSRSPSSDRRGLVVAFVSNFRNRGENSDENQEIFLAVHKSSALYRALDEGAEEEDEE